MRGHMSAMRAEQNAAWSRRRELRDVESVIFEAEQSTCEISFYVKFTPAHTAVLTLDVV